MMDGTPSDLASRFAQHLLALRTLEPGQRVVVALSGGMDSLTLLHLLRFGPEVPVLELHAAHFDHGMRPESAGDALWVRGVCLAWGVALRSKRAPAMLKNEEEARKARYEFLVDVSRELGTALIFTAHQADDQAETVLFRAMRGTGLRGLAGIPSQRSPSIVRPLLPFKRTEIEAYAQVVGLRPREDPSNADLGFARNLLRLEILPRAESRFAPAARESLRRLARLARENEAAWDSLVPALLEGVMVPEGGENVIARTALLAYHPAVQSRVLREWLRRHGISVDAAGTQGALEFTTTGSSGRSFQLPSGLRLVREFDRILLVTDERDSDQRWLEIPGSYSGDGIAVIGGKQYEVRWGEGSGWEDGTAESFASDFLRFPLQLRAWAPGDRIRLAYGSKKMKKLFSEFRIPQSERGTIPILVDREGRVLWACGVARSVLALPEPHADAFTVGLRHVRGY